MYCVDTEWLKSSIDFGFILDVMSYNYLCNCEPQAYLAKKAEASKDVVTIDTLDKLVEDQLQIDMTDKVARSRIKSLIFSHQ